MKLDHVQLLNCSQFETTKSALRFEGANYNQSFSKVSNSVIIYGWGRGIEVRKSDNVELVNNLVYFFSPIGINIATSNNI